MKQNYVTLIITIIISFIHDIAMQWTCPMLCCWGAWTAPERILVCVLEPVGAGPCEESHAYVLAAWQSGLVQHSRDFRDLRPSLPGARRGPGRDPIATAVAPLALGARLDKLLQCTKPVKWVVRALIQQCRGADILTNAFNKIQHWLLYSRAVLIIIQVWEARLLNFPNL